MIPTWGTQTGVNAIFNSAEFRADLTHSAVPDKAAPGTAATFTRATTATVRDNEGVIRTVPSGCARFEGARFVRNLCQTSSEVMTSANGWTASNCAQVKNLTGPDGVANSAYTVTASAGNALFYNGAATIIAPSTAACFSVYLKRVTGTGTIQISADGANTLTTVTLTSDWTRFSVVKTGTGSFGVIKIVTNGDAIGVARWQIEDITGRTDQTTPSEYVSVGVESAPYYHGSMVDGVKCFATDINGSPIPSSTLLGYQAEGARTNLLWPSNEFTNARFTVVTATVAATSATASPDGANNAYIATSTAGGGGASLIQGSGANASIVVGGSVYTDTFKIKANVGSSLTLRVSDNVTGQALVSINPSLGTVGSITGGVFGTVTCVVESLGNGWFAYKVTGTQPAGQIQHSIGLYFANNADSVYVYGWQTELGSFASSYIATTTIAVARNADVLTYSSSGNINEAGSTVYLETNVPAINTAASQTSLNIIKDGSNMYQLYQTSAGVSKAFTYTSSVVQSDVGTRVVSTNVNTKTAATLATNNISISVNGQAVETDATATLPTSLTTIYVGGYFNGAAQLNGTLRNVCIWQRAFSSSELQAVTS